MARVKRSNEGVGRPIEIKPYELALKGLKVSKLVNWPYCADVANSHPDLGNSE